jgi:hypothetical protein
MSEPTEAEKMLEWVRTQSTVNAIDSGMNFVEASNLNHLLNAIYNVGLAILKQMRELSERQ